MTLNFSEIKLPKSIKPCPISEAIVELRFSTKIPEDAIIGILYDKCKANYPDIQKLPILTLPPEIRNVDPNLRYRPHFHLKDEQKKYTILSSPRLVALAAAESYAGWTEFSGKIDELLKVISEVKLVDSLERLGLRYVNGFNDNISDKINLSLKLGSNTFVDEKVSLRIDAEVDGFLAAIKVANAVQWKKGDGEQTRHGSLIDIDVSMNNPSFNDVRGAIEKAHEAEKRIFFSLLKEEYLNKSFAPEY